MDTTSHEGSGPQAPPSPPPGSGFFEWIRGLGIVRGGDRWFAGVAGGIAAKAGIDPLIVRGVFVVLAILGGPGLLLYLVGWLLLPDTSGRIHVEEIIRGRAETGVLITAIVLAAVVIVPAILGILLPAATGLPAFGPWNWDLWASIGVPAWVTSTVAWLCWVAILVFAVLWGRRLLVRRGREPDRDGTPGPGAGAFASTATGSRPSDARADEERPGGGPAGEPGGRAGGWDATRDRRVWADDTGRRAEDWGQRASESAAQWGEDLGRRAEEWSARVADRHDAHRLGAGHVVITIALALLAAGLTALWALDTGAAAGASATGVSGVVIAALVAALAVLALSLIVAGVRGRHTGWVGFLAACGVVVLLFTAVLPWGTRFLPFGTVDVSPGTEAGVAVVAGTIRVDLADLDDRAGAGEDLAVWQLAGTTTVTLPEEAPTVVEVRVLAGNVEERGAAAGERRVSGPFLTRRIEANLGTTPPAEAARVTVTLLAGNVRIVGDPAGAVSGGAGPAEGDRAQEEELQRLEEELDRVAWQLEEPGLSRSEQSALEEERAELRETVDELEEEMAR